MPRFALRIILTCLPAAALVGCSASTSTHDWSEMFKKQQDENKPKHVGKAKFDVFGRVLGEGQEVSLSVEQFTARTGELLRTGRRGAVGSPGTELEFAL